MSIQKPLRAESGEGGTRFRRKTGNARLGLSNYRQRIQQSFSVSSVSVCLMIFGRPQDSGCDIDRSALSPYSSRCAAVKSKAGCKLNGHANPYAFGLDLSTP
jgi:hypothetical protein